MKEIALTCLLGIVVGAVDVLPMIKRKMDRYSVVSAFVFYFILPFIILNTELFGMAWWLKGGLIVIILALPMIIMVAGQDKKSIPPMVIMSVVLGSVIGIAGHFLIG